MKIFITGSEGFIGSHLTERLVKKGHDVKAFVMYNFKNSNGWLEDLSKDVLKNLKICKGDIRDFSVIEKEKEPIFPILSFRRDIMSRSRTTIVLFSGVFAFFFWHE